MARLQHVDDITSLLPLYQEGDALTLFMEMKEEDQKDISLIEARLKEAFSDRAFTAYGKLTMVRWIGECVDVYANKIRQLAGLALFEGAGLERFTKLAFITGFPNTIWVELQQAPNIKTLAMGDLLAWARVLTTGDQSQDMAVSSPRVGITPAAKSGSISIVICYRCNSKGHIAKDCRKHRTLGLGLFGKWNTGQGISTSLLPHEEWMRHSQQQASMLTELSVQH